jgi:ubiquinone/menaquinone biosynthesis C-methylase UbiE
VGIKVKSVWETRAEKKIGKKVELNEFGVKKSFDRDIVCIWMKEIAKKKQKKKIKMLDGGCSIGEYVMTAKGLGFDAYGIDISKSAIKECKKRGLKCVQGDVKNLPYKDKEFDLVTSGGVVEHFPDSEKAIAEASRVLKKRGILLIGVPYRYSFFVIVKKLEQLLGLWPLGYEQSFSKRKFEKILKRNGFKIIKFYRKPIGKGRRIPLVSDIIRTIDRVLGLIGLGGHFINYWCEKV